MPEPFLLTDPFIVPLVAAAPAGLRWLDCTPVLVTVPDGRFAAAPAELTDDVGLVADPALFMVPEVVTFSLIDGVVLTTDDLEGETAFVSETLDVETLFGVTLPDEACTLVAELLATVLFLLTVLLVPMPPLTDAPLLNTLSEPV